MIELKKIKKIYTNQTSQTVALDEVDISFPKRGFIAVTGESGSGKTTLLNILGCLDMPTSGEFFLEGRDMSEKSKSGNADFYASKIGMIFQDYNVFEDLTVLENIKMSTETVDCGNRNLEFELDEIMEFLGIKECANKYVRDLSGGQRQRVAIARAIIKKPLYRSQTKRLISH